MRAVEICPLPLLWPLTYTACFITVIFNFSVEFSLPLLWPLTYTACFITVIFNFSVEFLWESKPLRSSLRNVTTEIL